jgi:amphiphysin
MGRTIYDDVTRLNVYYLLLEKMHSFADENKWDISNVPGSQIAQEYEEKRTDAWAQIEDLSIVKRIVSVCGSLIHYILAIC